MWARARDVVEINPKQEDGGGDTTLSSSSGGAGGGPYRVPRRSRGRPDTHSAAFRVHKARVFDRMLEACGGKDSALRVAAAGARAMWLQARGRRAARRTACRAQVAPPALPMATHLCGRGRGCTWHARARFACTHGARAVRHGARTDGIFGDD